MRPTPSLLTPREITCTFCLQAFPGAWETSLKIRELPQTRDRILSGILNVYRCQHCGQEVRLDPTSVYTDFERGEAMAVLPDRALRWRGELLPHVERMFVANLEIACPPLVKSWAPRVKRRLVFGLPRAREKLLIWEAGLDDRVVEHMKLQLLLSQGLLPQAGPGADLTFEARADDALRFAWRGSPTGDGAPAEAGFEGSLVDYLRCRSADRPAAFTGALVDWRVLVTPDEPMPEEERAGLPLTPAPLPGAPRPAEPG